MAPVSKKRKMTPPETIYTFGIDIATTAAATCSESGQPSDQYPTNMDDSVSAVEVILKYKFNNTSLLGEALTHPSFTDSPSYQRLELVGDAVIGLVISNFAFLTYSDLDPGQLSLLRAANVSTERLARVAVHHGLHKYVIHNAIVLNEKVREFVAAVEEEEETVVHGGQIKAPKVLADIVESVAAAVYVDCGFNLQRLWMIIREILEPIVMVNILENQPHPITTLFEVCQKDGKQVAIKDWRTGEKNIASVYVDGQLIASGSSENKENARLHAAETALSKITRSKSSNATTSLQTFSDFCGSTEIEHGWPKPTYSFSSSLFSDVESIINYKFNNKGLLEEALTHSSYTDSPSYERLEFVGDTVIGLVITNFVFLTYPDLDPGQLSLLRAANISTERLARVAVHHGLHKYVRHNSIVLNEKVREFVAVVEEEEEIVVHGGQMKAPKVLADIVEAVAAAVYVDCGFNLQRLWMIIREILEPIIMVNVLENQPHPITTLFEICKKDGKQVDIKQWRTGERNIASVYVDGQLIASGSSENKENAKLHAAEAALSKITTSKSGNAATCLQTLNDFGGSNEIECVKQKVHELCNKKRWPKPIYIVEKELGPAHNRKYISSVKVQISDRTLLVKGEEKSRVKEAENSAASMMYRALRESGLI